jgi:hypothetical protein
MHIVVYQHSEAPLILDQVYRIEEEDGGDTIIIYDKVDGRTEFGPDDVIKFEGPNGTE